MATGYGKRRALDDIEIDQVSYDRLVEGTFRSLEIWRPSPLLPHLYIDGILAASEAIGVFETQNYKRVGRIPAARLSKATNPIFEAILFWHNVHFWTL